MKKRFLSILLALCMATQFVPTAALAVPDDVAATATVTIKTEQGSDQVAGDGENETALHNEAAINAVDETGDGSEPTLASANGTDGSDAAAHTHCVCGGSITAGDHSEHTSATWTAWDGTSDIEYANGVSSVYLSDNAARSNVLTVKDGSTLNLCLNGKTLSCSYTVIAVEGNATLNICDCKGGGQVASPSGCAVSVTTKNGSNAHTTLNLYGGKVSSKSYSMVDPGAIKLNNNDANNAQTVAVFNMYGGEVCHEDLNESAVYASYANIGSGYYQINMYGGNITCEKGNGFTSNNNQNVAIQVAGGTITAGWYGIWLSSQNTLTLSGNPKFVDKAYFDSNAGIYIPAEAALSVAGDFIPAEGTTISVTGDAVIARPAAGGSSLSGKAQYFVSSDEGYFVECNEDGNLQLTACAITDQPTADNGYAVAANGGSTDKVAYQWYKATSGKVAVTDKNATATGDFSYFGSSYGNEWYPRYDPESADQVTLEAFTLHMAKDDVLTVKYRNRDYAENNGPGRFDRFTLTGNDGEVEGIWGAEDWDTTYAFTAPADGDYTLKATVTPGTDEDPYDGSIYYNLWCDFSATVTADVAGDALSGQTAAALNTAELENGKYICGVTWEDKTTLYSNAVELSAPVHTHCVCGKTDCSGDGHDATTTWQPWTSDDSLPTGSGNYYLTDDVELSETWICGADVNLCLNGHDIIETGNADAIKVNGKTLAITDCHDGEEVGKITHAENALGRGINNWGNLALWNGNITGNSVVDYAAGVANWGEFTMFGGSVTGNSADEDGGGVYNLDGAFAMFGGSVTGNSAGKDGGGVYNFGFFNLSGSVTITGNTTDGADSNVYLPDGDAIAVATSGMGAGASVGVTAEAPGSTPTVVTGSTDATVFFSDDETYALTENDTNGLKLVLTSTLHRHKVCGEANCTNDNHGKELTWKAWTSTNSLPKEAGNYYLTGDVYLGTTWECDHDVNLCLNGHDIIETGDVDAVIVNEGKTLAITDCKEDIGEITHAETAKGRGVYNYGTLTLWNGNITGNSDAYGAGVLNFGSLKMVGGSISGNSAKYEGGGVYNYGTFNMNGGNVASNSAAKNGGGVSNWSMFTMTGGSIACNTANYRGGGVCNGGTFNMSGGSIARNTVEYDGGGVYNNGNSGDVTFTMSGGGIADNAANGDGGGVYNISGSRVGALNLSGGVTIARNTSNGAYSNVYLPYGEMITVTGAGLGDGASVGITSSSPEYGYTAVRESTDTTVFSSDNANYELVDDDKDGLKLSAKTVTISGVKLLVSDGGSVMTEDQSKVYDGLAVAYDDSEVAVEPNTVTGWELSYTWQKATVTDGVTTYTDLDAAPSDAGSYRLLVTAKRGEVELGSTELPFTIAKRPVTLASESYAFIYNGQAQKWEHAGVASGSFADGEGVGSYSFSNSVTNVGDEADNAFTYKLSDGTSADNYEIATAYGKLTVGKSGAMTVSGICYEGVYDGAEHGLAAKPSVTEGTKVEYSIDGGAWSETVPTVKDVADVTVKARATNQNYEQAETSYTLKVTPRGYTVVTDSASKVYDGEALTAGGKIEGIVDGEDAGFQVTGGQTEVGESKNTYEVKWDAGAKESNYEFLGETVGTLTVTAQSIDPGADPESPDPAYKGVQVGQPSDVEYNGQAQEQKPTVTDKDGNPLVEGVDYEISFSKDTVNVGEVTVTIKGTGNYAGTVERTYQITAKPLTIDHLVIAEKYYDGTNEASFIAKPVLVGVVSGDEVTLVNGVPIFTSVAVGRDIPISFTEFTLDGADAGNYALTQPSGITGDISAYNAFGTEYATTTTDWTNQAFVVTASSGWLVSETNTAEGTWSESLTRSAETGSAGDRLTFYVKSKDHGFISEAITKTYMIDKTVPSIKGARDGKTYCGAVVLTVTDANLDKVTVNGKVVEPTADEAMALAADAPAEFMFTVQPAEGEQTVVATDKAGNSTTLKLTVNDGHTWGAWTSNGNGTHTHACEYDDSTETADCHGGTATCIDRAVCDDCGQPYGEVDSSNHAALTHVEAKAATATAEGNIEYWYCEACGRYFADEAGAKEIQRSETVVAKKAEAPDGNKGGTTDGTADGKTGGNTGGSAAGAGSGKSQVPRTGDSTAAAWPPAILGAAALAAMLVSARRRRS